MSRNRHTRLFFHLLEYTSEIRCPGEVGNFYLMEHHVRVRDQIMRIRAEIALNTRVLLQHRGVLFALSASFAPAPDIVSQVMLTHYLHHPTRPRLLNEGFRFQHDDDKSF